MATRSDLAALICSVWPQASRAAVTLDLDLLADIPADDIARAVRDYRAGPGAEHPPTADKLRKIAGKDKRKRLDLPPPASESKERDRKWAIWFWERLAIRARKEGDEATALEADRSRSMVEREMLPNQQDIDWRAGWWDFLVAQDRNARPRRYEDWDKNREGPPPLWDLGSALDTPPAVGVTESLDEVLL